MRWLLDNPQILFVIGGAVAYWLNQRRLAREKSAEEAATPREAVDDETAERTRRIQEEIRRKIAERQGRSVEAAPPPLVREAAPPPLPPPRPAPVGAEETPGAAELERVMEEQRRYAETLDRLEAAERARQASGASGNVAPISMAAYNVHVPEVRARTAGRSNPWADELHDRAALRRAFVLREVLGAPKALQ